MKAFITFIGCIMAANAFAQNVGIGTANPATSAMLEVSSNSKGILIPRLTTAQRNAIASPSNGLMAYDTDTKSFWYYNGNSWVNMATPANGFNLPYDGTANSNTVPFKITNNGMGAAIQGHSAGEYGIGMTASSAGAAGWGLFATTTRKDAISVYAVADTGMVFSGISQPGTTSNNAMQLVQHGEGGAALFKTDNAVNQKPTLLINSNGKGEGLVISKTNPGNVKEGLLIQNEGQGNGLRVQMNPSNSAKAIDVYHSGVGPGVFSFSEGGNAIWGIANSVSAAAVLGNNPVGEAVVGLSSGPDGNGAIVGRNDNSGYGVRGFNTKNGIGVLGEAGISGGTGIAGRFVNVNAANATVVLETTTNGTGPSLLVHNTNAGVVNTLAAFRKSSVTVARIDGTGKGFFNGGTQNSGADIAEAFEVSGEMKGYEPGDVLVISTTADRMVEKSAQPYSALVAGVFATKPGVLLTEENIETSLDDKVPMGVIGVIPTKVCLEGGIIKRGDMLVTSSLAGVAMKGDPAKIKTGQVIGKALQDYNSRGTGLIQVLVSVK